MKYLSTFTGIGGFEVGIQRAIPEAVCIGYSEIDKYAIQTYEEHYEHTNYGDITTINAESLPDFDLIVGGFPCQAFSVAGKRKGFNETRGTLFFDLARILKHKRPGHFVFENVKGLLSHDGGKTIQTIAGVLSDLGYRIEWQVLNSKDFGVPQNRERIYIVGHLRERCGRQVFPIVQGGSWDIQSQGEPQGQGKRLRSDDSRTVASTLAVRDYKGGNNLIKQLNNPVHSNDRVYATDGIGPTLNTMQGGLRQPFVQVKEATKKGYAEATIGDTVNISMPTSKTRRGRVQKGLAGTLQTSESMVTLVPDSVIVGSHHDRETSQLDDGTLESKTQLRTEEASMLDMQTAERTDGDSSHKRGLARQPIGESTGTLPGLPHSASSETSELQSGRLQSDTSEIRVLRETQPEIQEVRQSSNDKAEPAQSGYRIRRLTVVECERLQGFPDGWTIGSDTQRYKQCGNAVTTNVVEAVMVRLKECLV